MRHDGVNGFGVFAAAIGAAVGAAVLPAAGPPAARAGATAARSGADPAATLIEYRGLRLAAPAGWPVYRLDDDPARCVRLDRPGIYLGRQGPLADCPARAVDRAEVLHVEPLDAPAARPGARSRGARAESKRLASYRVPRTAEREARLRLPAAGVSITGTYGARPEAIQRVLRAARAASAWTPAPARRPPAPRARRAPGRAWAKGLGFDTCTAPSLSAMRAWRGTYRIANIYIGGAARGCAQPNLTRSWVRQVRGMGYRLIPTYVGLQAPCTRFRARFAARDAAGEGRRAAGDATRKAAALGIPHHNPIYFDMEAYNSRIAWCRAAVLTFMDHWTRLVKAREYVSGFYSSAASGIRDIGLAKGIAKPGAVWYAHWDGRARVYGCRYLPDRWWHPHRRIKQYRGGHRETHGGVTLNVDSNMVDARVY